jgi:uroporphyrinogen-III synthase
MDALNALMAGHIVYEYRYHRPMPDQPLAGRRIALLESRLSADIATLVKRLGGIPVPAPSMREVPRSEDVQTFMEGVTSGRFAAAIFQTGAGATALLRDAEAAGQLPAVLDGLRKIMVACRGPKPLSVMRRNGVPVQIVTEKPHTTRELLQALSTVELRGRDVLLVHYGERNAAMASALVERGANLAEVCPYAWALPQDLAPVENVVRESIAGSLDAVLFTNQAQCRYLFQIADRMSLGAPLAATLNANVVVGAVGPVVADALRAAGITPDVLPASPTMVSLITAVGDYFELTRGEA